MKTVTTRELRSDFSRILGIVEAGELVLITRGGQRVAWLDKYREESERSLEVPDFRQLRRRLGTEGSGGPNPILEERATDS